MLIFLGLFESTKKATGGRMTEQGAENRTDTVMSQIIWFHSFFAEGELGGRIWPYINLCKETRWIKDEMLQNKNKMIGGKKLQCTLQWSFPSVSIIIFRLLQRAKGR